MCIKLVNQWHPGIICRSHISCTFLMEIFNEIIVLNYKKEVLLPRGYCEI